MDPLSATALGAAVLTQGIGFLYGQVAELLRRRRERKESPAAAAEPVAIPPAGEAGRVLEGQLKEGLVDEQALDRHTDQLFGLWRLLAPYAAGLVPIDPYNRQLLEQMEAARQLLEQIYRQHITFQGERRPPTGAPVQVETGDVGKYATQVIASGERAVAVGGDVIGTTVITGNQTHADRGPSE